MKRENYKGINTRFIKTNYMFLEVLTELSMLLGGWGYYPSMDSREQRYAIIDLAKIFCYNHQNTDWDDEDFLSVIDRFATDEFIKWAESEVLIKDSPFDKDDIKKIKKQVEKVRDS